ncbi:unnamed protein product [Nezara viridula]|uniref:RAVE complex protein Rav1 C-terminal domain-containing protein n=1 Tax=Nezara viridula TaxID=85310 RepID=A0A9P0ML42_NEZVI|nr:unnamed protein product [Nezara viridula]
MSNNICLYHTSCCHLQLVFRDVVKSVSASRSPVNEQDGDLAGHSVPLPSVVEEDTETGLKTEVDEANQDEEEAKTTATANTPGNEKTSLQDMLAAPPSPTLSMVTKHSNGTLNLWQLTFAEKTKFSQGFCSELILWRVDAVGPLSKSGGVSELARINSPQISAFSNVAWIPTLLPSTTLGNLSNSPSACFVASDGESLRVYQAVIDARTLLAEVSSSERRSRIMDWQNTQLLHVFQAQLISGERESSDRAVNSVNNLNGSLGLIESSLSAMVDLQQSAEFEEPFYLVVLERTAHGTAIHTWRLVIASQPDYSDSMMYVPDSRLVQDDDEGESGRPGTGMEEEGHPSAFGHSPHVTISTTKLPLPDGVDVIHAAPAGGHLSSASIYPACFAPYIIVTACSDSTVRFWKCNVEKRKNNEGRIEMSYEWVEWEMLRKDKASVIEIPGQPLNISAAYSGRIACAYKYGKSFTRPSRKDPESRYVNLCVAIYECESTGGLLAVPSFSTLQSLRKSIIENGNTCPLTQKHLVQLDWVSKEDGSHILTVGVGSKVMLFTPVSSDIAQANMKAMKESQTTNSRPILRKASSLAAPNFIDEIRWMKLRKIDLRTADGLPPLPMQISWVRDGILVVGMDSEMHESSQRRLANVSSMPHLSRVSSINLTLLSVENKKKKSNSSSGGQTNTDQSLDSYMPDYGLFEASRIACPVLPQYHPKQLMELLNSGKIRWVKAILAHLVRCISGTCSVQQGQVVCSMSDEENLTKQRGWSRSRTLSVSYGAGTTSPMEQRGSTTAIPEELTLDYAEITSIPPLPLWTLLAADKETLKPQTSEDNPHYNELFETENILGEEHLDDLLVDEDEDESLCRADRRPSGPVDLATSLSHFGPRQGRLLSRLLTHTHLPGLSSLDQMHLLALADTVSTCNTDFAERFAIDAAKSAIAKENLTGLPEGGLTTSDSLDDCGLRFLLAMKHYNYLVRCLPLSQRAQFQRQGMASNNLVWAFHSESEEELLSLIPSYTKGSPRWGRLKELGVGWWIRNHTTLKQCIEKVAKASFQANQDPLDAAIFYLAMKKKSLVWGLFRSKRDERMTQFFSNDFAEDRWRKAALKNAFALLGKQRFEHAAAFFLLAGALRDAIEVCLNKLEDLQLAMVISRLYEGEMDSTPPNLKRLLYEEILGCDAKGENQDFTRVHPDPFLRSMALWILKDPTGTNPNVFNFYVYLRTHPLLIRHTLAATYQDKKKHTVALAGFTYGSESKTTNGDRQLMVEDSITPLERQLYFTTAHAHFKAGCPALALEVLSKLPNKVVDVNSDDSSKCF